MLKRIPTSLTSSPLAQVWRSDQGGSGPQVVAANGAAELTQRVLALDAELSQLENEMMGGMIAASVQTLNPDAAAELAEQLSSWNRAIARMEAGAQQVLSPGFRERLCDSVLPNGWGSLIVIDQ